MEPTKEELFENYRQDFYEADAERRETILDNLRKFAEEDKEYSFLVAELEALEAEEELNYGPDKDELPDLNKMLV